MTCSIKLANMCKIDVFQWLICMSEYTHFWLKPKAR